MDLSFRCWQKLYQESFPLNLDQLSKFGFFWFSLVKFSQTSFTASSKSAVGRCFSIFYLELSHLSNSFFRVSLALTNFRLVSSRPSFLFGASSKFLSQLWLCLFTACWFWAVQIWAHLPFSVNSDVSVGYQGLTPPTTTSRPLFQVSSSFLY